MRHVIELEGGGRIHYSTIDAVFRSLEGKPIAMEFHHYCGPFFSIEMDDFNWLPEEDSPEWDHLWDQFQGWWDAKGRSIYR